MKQIATAFRTECNSISYEGNGIGIFVDFKEVIWIVELEGLGRDD
jgi:hypothetical protein